MGNSWIKDVSETEIEEVLNKNADMLNSSKGIFTNKILNLSNLLWVPFSPILLTIVACLEIETWYGKILSSILINLIVLPFIAIATIVDTVLGVLSIPLALLFEGIPAIFSKQYRKEFRLSRAVKKLARVLKVSRNKVSEYDAKMTLENPNVRRLISEINILNEQLGRNIPTSQDTVKVEKLEEYNNEQQFTQEQIQEQNKKYSSLKDFDKSEDKQHNGNGQEL